MCIFSISLTAATYSKYKDSFTIRYNILIRNDVINPHTPLSDLGKLYQSQYFTSLVADNNLYYFTTRLENFENFYNFKNEIKKELSESNIVKLNNTFLGNKYLRNEIHLVPGLTRSNENPDSYSRLTTIWIDKRTFPSDNSDYIEEEIKKIFVDIRNKNIEKQKKMLKVIYSRLSQNITDFCKAQDSKLKYLKKLNYGIKDVDEEIEFELVKNINQCLVALDRINKEFFFEKVMKDNEILANANPSYTINIMTEQFPIKKNIQLFYENILITILVFISILFLKNLVIKQIR